ncbi:alanine racemase [Thermodesulfobacteriota bacterium]
MDRVEQDVIMMQPLSFNRVEIDISALQANFKSICETVGSPIKIMAVVKSDAYGHGLVECARALHSAGARTFGVAEAWEGVKLRSEGLDGDIVVLLGGSAESYTDVIQYKLTPVVFDVDYLTGLSEEASRMKTDVQVHLKVDVGMGRIGVMPDEVETYVSLINRLPGVILTGVLSHFPVADEIDSIQTTHEQLSFFKNVLANLKSKESGNIVSHIANSAGLIYFQKSHMDMVRPGISLYGCYPDGSSARAKSTAPTLELQPVMSFKTRVIQIKEVGPGYGISYGHTFVTRRRSRLAVLPVGYADGYLRKLSNRAQVLIGGARAPVCGRVCMNATLVDVTDLPPVHTGDEAVLLGRQGNEEITADEIAGWAESISYEILCLFGTFNERVYV